MKRKMIALLLAAVSVSSLLVGCKDKEKEACASHADTNKDAVCDACGKDVVIVTEQLPAEKEPVIEMVVNPIAEGSLSDYLKTSKEAPTYVPSNGSLEELEAYESVSGNGLVYLIEEVDSTYYGMTTHTYTLYNIVSDSNIYEFETQYSNSSYQETCEVRFETAYICIKENREDEVIYRFLDYNGKTIVVLEEEMNTIYHSSGDSYILGDYGVRYFTIDGVKYAMDANTYKILHKAESDMFIQRPSFDKVVGNYGYVINNEAIYVYDLNEWIECVYVSKAPSYWMDVKAFVLENGNVLTQASVRLPDDAVNYDYLREDASTNQTAKYDIVYTIISPDTKIQTAVEFGYMITDEVSKDAYTNNALNVFTVNPIKNRRVNDNQTLTLVMDNDMNVLYSYKAVALGQNESKMNLVADGLFLSEIVYGDGTTSDIIVNQAGEITYLPRNYQARGGFVVVGNKVYDWQMNLKINLETSGYAIYGANGSGLFLSLYNEDEGETDYYFYTTSMNSPKHIGNSEDISGLTVMSNGFVVVSYDDIESQNVYAFYNNNCKKVAEFDSNISWVGEIAESGLYKITLADGSAYVVR